MGKAFKITEPFDSGLLEVSAKHKIYYEQVGNPDGKAILYVHGGPGGGISETSRHFFDPEFYRVILFDQRGCGKSQPFACMEENTSWDLVEDINKLRQFLQIDQWLVFGGSWGSTLSLLYAITYPKQVKGLILRGIFLARQSDVDWLFQEGCSYIYPDAHEEFASLIAENERDDLVSAYYKLLMDDDEKVHMEAAKRWSIYEGSVVCLIPDESIKDIFSEGDKALSLARTECHYFYHHSFLQDDNYILNNTDKIKDIPTIIIHGRYDVDCRLCGAYELHKKLPQSELQIIQDAGHSYREPGILSALVDATEKFKQL